MPQIYVLGDSHAAALIPRIEAAFPAASIRGQSFPGYSTARATAAMSPPDYADLVVVILGGNDFGDRSAERAALVSRLAPVGPLVWFGPAFAADAQVDQRHLRQTQDQQAQLPHLGVRFYDSRPWTQTHHREDGVHFTAAGYDQWATAIVGVLQRKLAAHNWARGVVIATLVAFSGYFIWRRLKR